MRGSNTDIALLDGGLPAQTSTIQLNVEVPGEGYHRELISC